MNAPDPLDSLRRRAVRHAFEDGAVDLVVGLFTLVMGAATERHIFLALAVVYAAAMTRLARTRPMVAAEAGDGR
jgi:hypothetical protein